MASDKALGRTVLFLILLIELWVFTGSFNKYFCHDSLFYMTRYPHSWAEFERFLRTPDDECHYRPLNLGFVALVIPRLGLNPLPYHWIPVIFHLLNTCLFYFLARRLLPSSLCALAATAFWGLHSVAGWITYDMACLADFFLAFLFLAALLLAYEGYTRRLPLLIAGSLAVYLLALLTKEVATTFPLAIWMVLGLAALRSTGEPATARTVWRSLRKTLPLAAVYLAIASVFAALFFHWMREGVLYTQQPGTAYEISPFSNLAGKAKYVFWALNLPDNLQIPNAERNRAIAFGLMGGVLAVWLFDIVRRRCKLSPVEWAGLGWFVGLTLPALLLSSRLAKWYLYLPLFGLALAFGVLAENLHAWFSKSREIGAGLLILSALTAPILFSSIVQTRSYLANSDLSFQSDMLQSSLLDFRETHPTLPREVTLFLLPTFEKVHASLLSAPPIDQGELYKLYYPEIRFHMLYAHKGDSLPTDFRARSDVLILQHLDRHLYDVTSYFRRTGKITIFLLPTSEGNGAPLLKKEPAGGEEIHDRYVQVLIADDGAKLPDDYCSRPDFWILRYMNGHFIDVTDYYKGRRRDSAIRVLRSLDNVRSSMSRDEYYPNYERFDTPTGAPVFFSSPDRDVVTQIGGSTAVIPLNVIPEKSHLRFDISWMYDSGDGAWAEVCVRAAGEETALYRQYMQPNAPGIGPQWKEVRLDLQQFAGRKAELILKCYNDKGKNTAADWLNWRDMAIETENLQASVSP